MTNEEYDAILHADWSDERERKKIDQERTPMTTDRRRVCTCLGTCRGAEGLSDSYVCALALLRPPALGSVSVFSVERADTPRRSEAPSPIYHVWWCCRFQPVTFTHEIDCPHRTPDTAAIRGEGSADVSPPVGAPEINGEVNAKLIALWCAFAHVSGLSVNTVVAEVGGHISALIAAAFSAGWQGAVAGATNASASGRHDAEQEIIELKKELMHEIDMGCQRGVMAEIRAEQAEAQLAEREQMIELLNVEVTKRDEHLAKVSDARPQGHKRLHVPIVESMEILAEIFGEVGTAHVIISQAGVSGDRIHERVRLLADQLDVARSSLAARPPQEPT